MRIAQLAPLVESVPPSGYGGIELVVSLLTEELVERGHDVTLFASGDSSTGARLISVTDLALRKNPGINRRFWTAYDLQLLSKLEQMQHEFDLIHNHMGWQALPFLEHIAIPSVTTNHNLIEDNTAPVYLRHKHAPYVSISQAYKRLNYPELLNYVDVVYNGINVSTYEFDRHSERSYLCFLGRVSRDKGTATAIEIAKRLRLPIRIAGKVDAADRQYFDQEVSPLLDPPYVEFIGEVNHWQKLELLRHAIALLYPVSFEEPFGLVMVESLACGVPVLALDRGAVREVLTDGETAIIGNTIDELIERYPEIANISRLQCRQRAQKYFSRSLMTDRYEALYRRLVTHTSADLSLASPINEAQNSLKFS